VDHPAAIPVLAPLTSTAVKTITRSARLEADIGTVVGLAHERGDGQMQLLGQFASSLLGDKWDPAHPSFDRFCRGLMAEPGAPAHLRNDPELRRLYPPKRLRELMPVNMAAALDLTEMRLAAKAKAANRTS